MSKVRSALGALSPSILLAAIRSMWSGASAVLVFLGALGLVAAVAAGIMYLLLPELRAYVATMLGLGILFMLIFLVGAFNQVKRAMLGRRGRYSTNTMVMIAAFIAIAVMVNFLGARNFTRFDVTAAGQYSLAPQTVKVLSELTDPVHAVGFFTPGDPNGENAATLLKEYTFRTDKFTFELVDPEANPSTARNYAIKDYGVVVFESGQRRQQVTAAGEQGFTGALLKVTGKQQKRVYFLTGHDERNFADGSPDGYSLALKGLQADNYEVAPLSLATTAAVPEDAAALVIAGPKKPLLEAEVKPLQDYLNNKGKVLMLLEPNPPEDMVKLLAPWGVVLDKGSVIDQTSFVYPDAATPAAQRPQYLPSQITKDLDTTFFPSATSVGISPDLVKQQENKKVVTVTVSPLALTTPNSWFVKSYDPKKDPPYDAATDKKGPLALAVSVEATAALPDLPVKPPEGVKERKTRVVVVGDSDFASNQYFYSLGNSDLFLNSINWLSGEEELISIRPKPPAFRRMVVTQAGWRWIVYSSIALLPLAVAAAGALNWWRRR
ncbi:MAG: GldG family protein [Chloroflexi bacterium]|nr:GldG family protein [Chloroflexota bacterium]